MENPTRLNANSLGIAESVIMGIAGTAPAYSIEITTSTIVATAGVLSPASVLACGLIMLMNNVHYVTLIAALWLTAVSAVVVKGIKLTSYVQVFMTIIEGIILLVIIVVSFIVFPRVPQHAFSWGWFWPFNSHRSCSPMARWWRYFSTTGGTSR